MTRGLGVVGTILVCVSHEDVLLPEPEVVLSYFESLSTHSVFLFFLHSQHELSPASHNDNGSIKGFPTAGKPWQRPAQTSWPVTNWIGVEGRMGGATFILVVASKSQRQRLVSPYRYKCRGEGLFGAPTDGGIQYMVLLGLFQTTKEIHFFEFVWPGDNK